MRRNGTQTNASGGAKSVQSVLEAFRAMLSPCPAMAPSPSPTLSGSSTRSPSPAASAGRHGRYRVARLLEELGPDGRLTEWRSALMADSKVKAGSHWGMRAGARCRTWSGCSEPKPGDGNYPAKSDGTQVPQPPPFPSESPRRLIPAGLFCFRTAAGSPPSHAPFSGSHPWSSSTRYKRRCPAVDKSHDEYHAQAQAPARSNAGDRMLLLWQPQACTCCFGVGYAAAVQ